MKHLFHFSLIGLLLLLSACAGSQVELPLSLATFTENSVAVSIQLEQGSDGQIFLAATFAPTKAGMHLYSKDIPLAGQDGLGRPTLLELAPGSVLQAAGDLTADVEAVINPDDSFGLPLYPVGPVTLRLPVDLPEGDDWVDEQVSITYMACTAYACLPPVEGKIIDIRIPPAGLLPER